MNLFAFRSATAVVLTLVCAAPAVAADWVFSHIGFGGGATITGSFSTGVDTNGDGAFAVDRAAGEVSMVFRPATAALTVSAYPGANWPAPFSWDSASDGTASPYFYSRVFGGFGSQVSYTDRSLGGQWFLSAAPVPEPSSAMLMLLGAAAFGLRRHLAYKRTR